MLVTSDTVLGIEGERVVHVPPLAPPLPGASFDQLLASDAVTLFAQIAEQAHADYTVTSADADAVADICRVLRGIPLLIELAAARIDRFTAEQLLDAINALQPSKEAPLDDAALLHAVLDWSVSLLASAERELFCKLAVFVGGCVLDGIRAVCFPPDTDIAVVEQQVAALHSARLVRRWRGAQGLTYVRQIAAVRAYADGLLQASENVADIRNQHAAFYTQFAEEAEPHLVRPEQMLWYERLEDERDNFRAALRWLIDSNQAELGLRLGAALWRFWDRRGYNSEGRVWLSELLAIPLSNRTGDARTIAQFGAGRLSYQQGDLQIAQMLFEESLWSARESGSDVYASSALTQLGHVATRYGQFARAKRYYEESLAIRRAQNYRFGIAITLHALGDNARHQGDYATARALMHESMEISREIDYIDGLGKTLGDLALLEENDGRLDIARECAAEAIAIHRAYDDRLHEGYALHTLGLVELDEGRPEVARDYLLQALAIYEDSGTRDRIITAIEALADVYVRLGEPARAIRMVAVAGQTRKQTRLRSDVPGQQRLDRAIARARELLGSTVVDAICEEALQATLADAIAEATAPLASPQSSETM